ncbi:MAG: hypothetical protein R3268_07405 [Acidiferrobacterales bacterium]|nr:hypothetical protein [Acidiferrobacterales bacterium]
MLTMTQRTERLVVLAVIGILALNYPALSLFAHGGLLFGIPVLYLYLFLVWVGLIALAAAIIERKTGPISSFITPETRPGERTEQDA